MSKDQARQPEDIYAINPLFQVESVADSQVLFDDVEEVVNPDARIDEVIIASDITPVDVVAVMRRNLERRRQGLAGQNPDTGVIASSRTDVDVDPATGEPYVIKEFTYDPLPPKEQAALDTVFDTLTDGLKRQWPTQE